MDWLIAPLRYSFMQTGFTAAVLIGLTCGVLGVYVVHRRMAFIGDALAHATLPGLVIAFLFKGSLSLGAMVAGVSTALGIGWIARRQKIKEDTGIGITFTAMFALGILLMSLRKSYNDLLDMLVGNIVSVTSSDLYMLAGVAGVVLLCLFLFHKELELTSFDPTHAEVIGIRTDRLRYLLLILLALVVVAGVQVVGVVLIIALLITPAAAAALLTNSFARAMWIAAAISVGCSIMGLYVSYYFDASAGAAIVLACTAVFGLLWLGKSFHQRLSAPSTSK